MTLKQIKCLMLVTFSAAAFSQASAGDVKVSGEASGYIQQFSSSTKAAVEDAKAVSVSKWKQGSSGDIKASVSEMKGGTTYSATVKVEGDTGAGAKIDDAHVKLSMDSGLSIAFGGVRGSGVFGSASVGDKVSASGGASHSENGAARAKKGAVISYMTGDITAELGVNMYSEAGDSEAGIAEKSFMGFRPYVKYNTDMIHVDFAYGTLSGTSTDDMDKDATAKSGMALNAQYSGGGIKAGFNYGSGTSEETAFTPAEAEVKADAAKGVDAKAAVKESKTVTTNTPNTMGVYFGYDLGSGMGVGLNYKSTTEMKTVKVDGKDGAATQMGNSQTWLGYSHNLDDGPVTYYVTYSMATATSEDQKGDDGKDIEKKYKYQQDTNGITFKMKYAF